MEKYIKSEVISLKNHPTYTEKWVQQKIADDPNILASVLGLNEIDFKDSERIQQGGGRLDLLLSDPITNTRFEVELQLGKTDESHIIRTLEYWSNEQAKYPEYSHVAVIIAEDITSRFLNVISLFNGHIPIIAIQVKALKIDDKITLFFTKVLDKVKRGTEAEDKFEPADPKFWETKASKESLSLADEVLSLILDLAPGYKVNYTKNYLGISKDGISQNFISFNPRKNSTIILNIKHEENDDFKKILDESEIDAQDILSYDKQWGQYRIRLNRQNLTGNKEAIRKMIEMAFNQYMS